MQKSISFVGSVGIPAKYGGFETLVENLCIQLKNEFKLSVFCSSKQYNNRNRYWKNTERIFIPLKANGAQSILYDLISMVKAFRHSDIVVILGGSAGIFVPFFKLVFRKKKIVFHPDGNEWQRKKWNSFASFYLWVSIKIACFYSERIIIDNKELLKNYQSHRKKIVQVSYGGDHFKIKENLQTKNYWLTIARAESENSLMEIAKAFSKTPLENWLLVSNANQTKFGKKLANFCKDFGNIHLANQSYVLHEIEEYYQECKGYIHGHTAGGTNPTLTAAMWLNKPLICHRNIFNEETTRNHALFFDTPTDLAMLLRNNIYELEDYKQKTKELAEDKYTWEKVGSIYKDTFNSL